MKVRTIFTKFNFKRLGDLKITVNHDHFKNCTKNIRENVFAIELERNGHNFIFLKYQFGQKVTFYLRFETKANC